MIAHHLKEKWSISIPKSNFFVASPCPCQKRTDTTHKNMSHNGLQFLLLIHPKGIEYVDFEFGLTNEFHKETRKNHCFEKGEFLLPVWLCHSLSNNRAFSNQITPVTAIDSQQWFQNIITFSSFLRAIWICAQNCCSSTNKGNHQWFQHVFFVVYSTRYFHRS